MKKLLGYLKVLLIGVSLLMVILFALGTVSLSFLINYSLFLLLLLVTVSLGAAGLNLFENPKRSKHVLLGIAALVLFYFIGMGIASDSIDLKTQLVVEGSKQAEAGIYTLYFVICTAVMALLYSSVKRLSK